MSEMTRRSLRAMRDRWEADLERLTRAYPDATGQMSDHNAPEHETIRNLVTAIAQIDGIIVSNRSTQS